MNPQELKTIMGSGLLSFPLTGDEYPGIIRTAVDTCRGIVPIVAGAGGPTRLAIQCAVSQNPL